MKIFTSVSLAALLWAPILANAQGLNPEEFTSARAECDEKLAASCLLWQALGEALQTKRNSHAITETAVLAARLGEEEIYQRIAPHVSFASYELLRMGRWNDAREAFGNEKWITELSTPQGSFASSLAGAQLEAGEVELALKTADFPKLSQHEQANVHFGIIKHWIEKKNYQQALSHTERLIGSKFLDGALELISEAMAEDGRLKDALVVAARLPIKSAASLRTHNFVADMQIEAGDLDGARATLRLSQFEPRDWSHFRHAYERIDLLVATGQLESARSLALTVRKVASQRHTSTNRSINLSRIAFRLARTGQADIAQQTLKMAEQNIEYDRNDSSQAVLALRLYSAMMGIEEFENLYVWLREEEIRRGWDELDVLLKFGFIDQYLKAAQAGEASEHFVSHVHEMFIALIGRYLEEGMTARALAVTADIQTSYTRLNVSEKIAATLGTDKTSHLLDDLELWFLSDWQPEEYDFEGVSAPLTTLGAMAIRLGHEEKGQTILRSAYDELSVKPRWRAKGLNRLARTMLR